MTHVDQVLVNRLKNLAHIDLDDFERQRLYEEISQALSFIGQLEHLKGQGPLSTQWQTVRIAQLRDDKAEKTRFAFLDNVPAHEDGYVVV